MSIGETLANERQQAGLTVTQVSLQTRIRETVIRGMEHDDFSMCGGNFYARGHIRSISRVIGIDPEPLVREFDETHGGAPQPVSAVSAFEPEQPVAFRERRSPNWSAAMAFALALVVIYGIIQVIGHAGKESRTAQQVAGTPAVVSPSPTASAPAQQTTTPAAAAPVKKVELRVKARRTTWILVRGDKGKQLYMGTLRPGDVERWSAKKKISIVLGNLGGVRLTVNGKDLGTSDQTSYSFTTKDPKNT